LAWVSEELSLKSGGGRGSGSANHKYLAQSRFSPPFRRRRRAQACVSWPRTRFHCSWRGKWRSRLPLGSGRGARCSKRSTLHLEK